MGADEFEFAMCKTPQHFALRPDDLPQVKNFLFDLDDFVERLRAVILQGLGFKFEDIKIILGSHAHVDHMEGDALAKELTKALKRLATSGQKVSLEGLRKAGVSEATLARTIVIEFGSGASAFDAVSPEDYVVNGETIPLRSFDERFV